MKAYYKSVQALFILVFMFGANILIAQVTLNCESGNRAIDQGNCWGFGAASYSNTSSMVISGVWSVRTNSLSNQSPTACWVKSPWMLPGSGNITLKSRLDGNGNGVTSKGILIFYIPYVPSASYGEGVAVQMYTYSFPSFYATTIRDISVPIPPEIANSNQPYKFRVSFVGQGGNERAFADEFVFPGTYWSDPSASCSPMTVIIDQDGDGIADSQDNYPADPYKAFNNYFPTQNTYGTLAFEDSWPYKSDYDLNDLVVDYRINTITNAANQVVEVNTKVVTRASGASYKNAFCYQLDGIAANKIINCTGNHIGANTIFSLQANGLEANQNFANCIVFDNFFDIMTHPGGGTGINTNTAAPFVPYDTLDVKLVFIQNGVPATGGTVLLSELSPTVFNFYIVANQLRGNEIHLADRVPTNLINSALFGKGADDSNPETGRYFKTDNNLPWGLHLQQGFDYPVEKESIDNAYNYFVNWAITSGSNNSDWYQDKVGFRNNSKVYRK